MAVRVIEGVNALIVLDEVGSINDPGQPLFGAMCLAFASREHVNDVLRKAEERGILDAPKRPRGARATALFDDLALLICGDGSGPGIVPQIVYVKKDAPGVQKWIHEYPSYLADRTGLPEVPPAANLLWAQLVNFAFCFAATRVAIKGENIFGVDLIYDEKRLDRITHRLLETWVHRYLRGDWMAGTFSQVEDRFPSESQASASRYQVTHITLRDGKEEVDKELQLSHLLGRMLLNGEFHVNFLRQAWRAATVMDMTHHYPGAAFDA